MNKKIFLTLAVVLSLLGCSTQQLTSEQQKKIKTEKDGNFEGKIKSQSLNLVNVKVNYSGPYKVTANDKRLMKTYHRRSVQKSFKRGNKVFLAPTYDYLKMNRSGPNWSVFVEEQISGKFNISGKNSKGKELNGVCESIQQCFSML